MNAVCLSDFERTRAGLSAMLAAVLGDHGFELSLVEVPIALLVIELAKRADDRAEWFPHGKWATIQNMQGRVAVELDRAWGGSRGKL